MLYYIQRVGPVERKIDRYREGEGKARDKEKERES